MKKTCVAHLGLVLLALHLLSSQVVQASNASEPMNMTTTTPMTNYMSNSTMNMTNVDNGSGRMDALTLLLPLALGACLFHGWSQ